jgi:hypothetical protein
MTSYAEMARERKRARVLYLELRALGLDLRAEEDPEDPTGYRLVVEGTRSLSPTHADRIEARVRDAKPGMLRVLRVRWDEDLEAIRREGVA